MKSENFLEFMKNFLIFLFDDENRSGAQRKPFCNFMRIVFCFYAINFILPLVVSYGGAQATQKAHNVYYV